MRLIHFCRSPLPAGVRCAHFFYCNHNIHGSGLKWKKSLVYDALIIHCIARLVAELSFLFIICGGCIFFIEMKRYLWCRFWICCLYRKRKRGQLRILWPLGRCQSAVCGLNFYFNSSPPPQKKKKSKKIFCKFCIIIFPGILTDWGIKLTATLFLRVS
jgi:hypothetical protein